MNGEDRAERLRLDAYRALRRTATASSLLLAPPSASASADADADAGADIVGGAVRLTAARALRALLWSGHDAADAGGGRHLAAGNATNATAADDSVYAFPECDTEPSEGCCPYIAQLRDIANTASDCDQLSGELDKLVDDENLEDASLGVLCGSQCYADSLGIMQQAQGQSGLACSNLIYLGQLIQFVCLKEGGEWCLKAASATFDGVGDALTGSDSRRQAETLSKTCGDPCTRHIFAVVGPLIAVALNDDTQTSKTPDANGCYAKQGLAGVLRTLVDLLCVRANGQWCVLALSTTGSAVLRDTDKLCTGCGRVVASGLAQTMRDSCQISQAVATEGYLSFACGTNSAGTRCSDFVSRADSRLPAECGTPGESSWLQGGCSAACKSKLAAAKGAMGCCSKPLMRFWHRSDRVAAAVKAANVGGDQFDAALAEISDAAAVRADVAFEAAMTAAAAADKCGVALTRSCATGRAIRRAMHIRNVRLSWLLADAANMRLFETGFALSLADQFGVSPDAFTVFGIAASETGVTVEYDVRTENDAGTTLVDNMITEGEAQSSVNMVILDSVIPRTAEARHKQMEGFFVSPSDVSAAPAGRLGACAAPLAMAMALVAAAAVMATALLPL